MNSSIFLWEWLIHSLFWLGALVVLIGIAFLVAPGWVLGLGKSLNRWISTKAFFDSIDKPRYQERWFYRHHRISGLIIVIVTFYVFYVFLLVAGMDNTILRLTRLADSEFTRWLYVQLFYIFLVANFVALIIGVIIFIRPSLLKSIEENANRWISIDEKLGVFDSTIPTDAFVGRPRLFGLAVIIGGLYIMISTGMMLL